MHFKIVIKTKEEEMVTYKAPSICKLGRQTVNKRLEVSRSRWFSVEAGMSNELYHKRLMVRGFKPKFKLPSSQLCGCSFSFFTETQAQAAHMKTLYLWVRNALWRQEGFPVRPQGPFSTVFAHVSGGKKARSPLVQLPNYSHNVDPPCVFYSSGTVQSPLYSCKPVWTSMLHVHMAPCSCTALAKNVSFLLFACLDVVFAAKWEVSCFLFRY